MKKFAALLLAGALMLPAALSDANFEGKVTMKMSTARGNPQLMTFSLKEGFSRIDMSVEQGMSMGMIMDQTKQEMTILMTAQKMYMVRPIPKPDMQPDNATKPGDYTVEKTSIHETILGYDCVKYIAKAKDATTEIWGTDQLGTYMGMGGGGGPMGGRRGSADANQAWEKVIVGKNFFPLRVVILGNDAKETYRMEATAVEKQSLPASLFAPPADFQKFDMGNMMKGMMPGVRPPGGN